MNNHPLTTTHITPGRNRGRQPLGWEAGDQEALVARLAEEMADAWRQGKRARAELFLDRFPQLWNQPPAVMDLLYEEICLHHEYGEPVNRQEMVRRFPAWKQQVEILLNCASTLEPGVGSFPEPGETLGDFHLLAELGRGGQGRVFVASQTSLGDRPVVLKITARQGAEHLSLARLQHTHIVPILSVQDMPGRNLRLLCMPYFGGITLAAVLDAFKDMPIEQRTGQQILEILDEARAAAIPLPPSRDPATSFLKRASYVQAVCWLGACLAEALKYAHERGLVHLDLKPSNVLLTADRQPMLLDFHLARPVLRPGDPCTSFGGTPGYMSPEQMKAMTALKNGGTIPDTIDGRSDIYSLGLVLHEALARNPSPLAPLHQVSTGLSDIIGKCLSPEAEGRYANAGTLAADLLAHLNDLPLKGVANRSLVERWRKWRRRKPHLLSMLALLAAVFVVAGAALLFAFSHAGHRVDEARLALADGQKHFKNARYADAVSTLQRGLFQLENLPGYQELKDQLTSRLHQATRAKVAQELHHIADQFRFLYGMDANALARLEAMETHCRVFWDKRDLILDKLGKELEPEMEQRAQIDLLDMAILGSNLRVRLAGANRVGEARREALRILDQAESLGGPTAVLFHERRKHAVALGLDEVARQAEQRGKSCPPRTAWEHYALGRSHLQEGDLPAAATQFDQALALQPNDLWPNFFMGICSFRQGRFEDATLAFTACTVLAPESSGCFFNRGLAFVRLNRHGRALQDFDRALQLDPGCGEAALNRGLLLSGKKRE